MYDFLTYSRKVAPVNAHSPPRASVHATDDPQNRYRSQSVGVGSTEHSVSPDYSAKKNANANNNNSDDSEANTTPNTKRRLIDLTTMLSPRKTNRKSTKHPSQEKPKSNADTPKSGTIRLHTSGGPTTTAASEIRQNDLGAGSEDDVDGDETGDVMVVKNTGGTFPLSKQGRRNALNNKTKSPTSVRY